jgi:hypothetical protein
MLSTAGSALLLQHRNMAWNKRGVRAAAELWRAVDHQSGAVSQTQSGSVAALLSAYQELLTLTPSPLAQ